MTTYRKLPVEIEARQWDGTVESATAIIDWALSNDATIRYHEGIHGPDYVVCATYLAIDTLEGTMNAFPGAWVIRGVKGEFYACADDVFQQTYEAVEQTCPGGC